MLGASGVSLPRFRSVDLPLSHPVAASSPSPITGAHCRLMLAVSPLWLSSRALFAREGWSVSRKQVQCIRRKEGLKVRLKLRRIPRQGVSTGLPTQVIYRKHVWTWDFIFDRTDKGSTLKMLTMLNTRADVWLSALSDRFDPNRSWPPFGRR